MLKAVVWAMLAGGVLVGGWPGGALAQSAPGVATQAAQTRAWIQIEAQPTLRAAEERARAYAGAFDDVAGFALASGWYAIVLGPYAGGQAAERLSGLRSERLVPGDSFVADGGNFRQQFWPLGAPAPGAVVPAEPSAAVPAEPAVTSPAATSPAAPLREEALPEETLAESRRAEAALSRPERQDIQSALQWQGFYSAAIDGAFGAGTRAAIAAFQATRGAEQTGVLTTSQRRALIQGWQDAQAAIGLERIRDEEAGIEIDLPMGLVQFERYAPPFAHYDERDGSGVRVLLISQPGDQAALAGLYDLLQTLEIVPMDGPRERRARSFEISGRNPRLESYSYAELASGLIKGYVVVWPTSDGDRMSRVLTAMKASFRAAGNRALDPGFVPLDDARRAEMLTGLAPRRPALTRSGFFIDPRGTVLTVAEAVAGCDRITLDGTQEAEVVKADAALGVAVLRPRVALAPRNHARFAEQPPREGSEVAVAGYSFGEQLSLPTVTFGSFALIGDGAGGAEAAAPTARLLLDALPGDIGGPVLDATGAVIGLLLPRAEGGARVLPAEVGFVAPVPALTGWLSAGGLGFSAGNGRGALAPEDITAIGSDIAVMVSCWR